MKQHKSSEDYLEAILMIRNKSGNCRSIDVAAHMGFSKPSVSIAMAKLASSGLVSKDEDGQLYLTDAGNAIAIRTLEKHNFLIELLTHIGVQKETAEEDACLLEHSLSDESFAKLKEWFEERR
ncbi:MAG: metal-dependent transcriptional regulator [Clostridia bacterium]|nr:metal-dependent transcriptional regulator [Clostridia bacterium]